MHFRDRRSAGKRLAREVSAMAPLDPVVLALPRGGVPVGFEVADELNCDLDVLVVRKVGVPGQPEFAMGAVAEHGIVVRNEDVLAMTGVSDERFSAVADQETRELERRISVYRDAADAVDVEGKTVIVVDDGLATGSTAQAGISAMRNRGASAVWLAVPVAPLDTVERMSALVDQLVVVDTPRYFRAVGMWYLDFGQTTDDEVRNLLSESRLR